MLRSHFADDPDMRDILVEFVDGLPAKVAEMRRLLETKDLTSLRRLAHQLKGAGGGYGFDEITSKAAIVEEAIKNGQNDAAVARHIGALMDVVRSVEGYNVQQEKSCTSES